MLCKTKQGAGGKLSPTLSHLLSCEDKLVTFHWPQRSSPELGGKGLGSDSQGQTFLTFDLVLTSSGLTGEGLGNLAVIFS